MRTDKQRAASRLNGAKSRGPVTQTGKIKASRNSRRHGLYARHAADWEGAEDGQMPAETPLPAFTFDDPPATDPIEIYLIQAALQAHQDRMRIVFLETRLMNQAMDRQSLLHPEESELTIMALAFSSMSNESGAAEAIYRCEGAAIRRWQRAEARLVEYRLRPIRPYQPAIKNHFCETNPTSTQARDSNQPNPHAAALVVPDSESSSPAKPAYNRRRAIHATAHPHRAPSGRAVRLRPGPHHEAAHARPHPSRLQLHPPRLLPRRAGG